MSGLKNRFGTASGRSRAAKPRALFGRRTRGGGSFFLKEYGGHVALPALEEGHPFVYPLGRWFPERVVIEEFSHVDGPVFYVLAVAQPGALPVVEEKVPFFAERGQRGENSIP